MKEIIYLFKKPDGEHGCIEASCFQDAIIELHILYGSGVQIVESQWPDYLTIMDINDQSKNLFETEISIQGFYLEIKNSNAS